MDNIYYDINNLFKDKSLKPFLKINKNDLQDLLNIKNYNNLVGIYYFLKDKLTNFIESSLPKISYEYKKNKKTTLHLIKKIELYMSTYAPVVIKMDSKKFIPKNSKKKKYKIVGSTKFLSKSKTK